MDFFVRSEVDLSLKPGWPRPLRFEQLGQLVVNGTNKRLVLGIADKCEAPTHLGDLGKVKVVPANVVPYDAGLSAGKRDTRGIQLLRLTTRPFAKGFASVMEGP